MLFKNRYLHCMLVITSVLLIVILFQLYELVRSINSHITSANRLGELNNLSQQIIYHDEVLTMSARIGVIRETEKWYERYRAYEQLLDQEINRAVAIAPELKNIFNAANTVNQVLIKTEHDAFELAFSGRNSEAFESLFQPQYLNHKQEYADSIQLAIADLKKMQSVNTGLLFDEQQQAIFDIQLLAFLFLAFWLLLLWQIITTNRMLRWKATTDELTGLFNRREFDASIIQSLNSSRRLGTQLMLAICDLDNFKQFNDQLGHSEGDVALKKFSQLLSLSTRRATESAFRVGGEEFAIIAQVRNQQEGIELMKGLYDRLERLQIPHPHNPPHSNMTVSAGVCFVPDNDYSSVEEIYQAADQALYKAKSFGRNQFLIAHRSAPLTREPASV